jgi:DNA-binding MurR/RpiR family transcriptional regulator
MVQRSKRAPHPKTLLSLSARLGLLSPKRQATIRPALEHPRECVLMSVRALAERLQTDPATTVRIVRGMQFGSYREFQHYLHELSIAHATSLENMQTGTRSGLTVPAQIKAALDQDRKNLDAIAQTVDPQKIAILTRRIYSAEHILLIGGDLAAHLVNFLEHHLMLLGLPVSTATTPAEVVHKVRFIGKKDLVIAISFRRGLRQTVEGLRQARANGAYCAGITDSLVSPIGQFAQDCLLTSVNTPSFGASYVAPMALLNVLVVACANYKRGRTLTIMKKVEEEQRRGFRWYES